MPLYMHSCRNRYGQREAYLQRPKLPVPKDREDRPRLFRLEDRLAPAALVPPLPQPAKQRENAIMSPMLSVRRTVTSTSEQLDVHNLGHRG